MRQINLQFIRSRRKELKLSQQEVADSLGFKNASTYSKYESGEYALKANMLPKLGATLEIPVENFFTLTVSKTEH